MRDGVRFALTPRFAFTALTALMLGAATLATLAWVLATLATRPLDGVEGEVLYEASRLRDGLALYVDPIVGTADVPPSRFYVLYPPVWSSLLAPFSGSGSGSGSLASAALIGRAFAYLAFVASVALVAWRARPLRDAPLTGLASLFALSFFPMVLFGASARPDSLALLLATTAFARTLRREGLDAWAGVLFALALLSKPNMMGLALGVFAHAALHQRRAMARPLLAGLGVGTAAAVILTFASGGAFAAHLLRSTGQSLSLSLWVEQLGHRLPFVTLPIVLAVLYAWPRRACVRVQMALFALGASLLWTFFCLAKIGSASNYWMEPSMAALALVACAEAERRPGSAASRAQLVATALLLAQSLWNGVAAIKSSREDTAVAFARRDALVEVSRQCITSPTHVVLADEPGLELQLNGRLLGTPFQMAHLFAAGRLPRAPWLADLDRPEVRCVVVQRPELEGEGERWPREHRRFDLEIRSAIRERFALDVAISRPELFVYRRRDAR